MIRGRTVLAGAGWVLLAGLCIAAPVVPLVAALVLGAGMIVLRRLAARRPAAPGLSTAAATLATIMGVLDGVVRRLALVFAAVAAVGVVAMMAVTCTEVASRRLANHSLVGAVDLVSIAMVFTIAGALPYTTAVKGHVAVEYFFRKLPPLGRIIVDTLTRVVGIALFAVLWYRCMAYGVELRRAGEVMPTLDIPVFWLMWVIGASCGLVALVILYNLFHPGREMIKP
ncbi:MAG: TRAP transporter small permease [Planctomycetota bacterium]